MNQPTQRTEEATKQCAWCKRVAPRAEFFKSPTKDGRAAHCKACNLNQERRRRAAKHSTPYRVKRPDDPAKGVPRKVKDRARKELNNAVCEGKIVKPETCEECGARPQRHKLHGHHEDYTKFLKVEWLCRVCHEKRHTIPWVDLPEQGGECP
jgi:hypothetical protein